ncbi:hypothetical protein BGY98DRAFT_939674 [Russula aff. rugulosa BPL654]|nr:hypothetical protein BGY98DRAFT_939674 [Russula aff. rugulosa BPL654]
MKERRQLKPLFDGQQQDAEEFLSLILTRLKKNCPHYFLLLVVANLPALHLKKNANPVESPITRIFGGKFCSHDLTSNKPDVVTTKDWRLLHIDIQHDSIRTVQDTLAHISQPQSGEQISASGLGNPSQQVFIQSLPPVLVLHLNRVRYDAAAGGITKIGKSIQLAPELEIPLDIMVPTARRPSEPPHYKLQGILYHHGESAGSGHYTVDILYSSGDDDTGEVWLHIDDEIVKPMRHEDVFGGDNLPTGRKRGILRSHARLVQTEPKLLYRGLGRPGAQSSFPDAFRNPDVHRLGIKKNAVEVSRRREGVSSYWHAGAGPRAERGKMQLDTFPVRGQCGTQDVQPSRARRQVLLPTKTSRMWTQLWGISADLLRTGPPSFLYLIVCFTLWRVGACKPGMTLSKISFGFGFVSMEFEPLRCCGLGNWGEHYGGPVVNVGGVTEALALHRPSVVTSPSILAHGSMPWESRTMMVVAVQGAPVEGTVLAYYYS